MCVCRSDPSVVELKELPVANATNSVSDSSPYYEELSFARPPPKTKSFNLARNESYRAPGGVSVRVAHDSQNPNHSEGNNYYTSVN